MNHRLKEDWSVNDLYHFDTVIPKGTPVKVLKKKKYKGMDVAVVKEYGYYIPFEKLEKV